jgi:predicted nuclease of restriction endonuclease-like RecB superfamily
LKFLTKEKEIKNWTYESETFEILTEDGSRFYTPDFKIVNNDKSVLYHEVKGWINLKCLNTLVEMARQHPQIKIVLIEKENYRKIERQFGKLLNWEVS